MTSLPVDSIAQVWAATSAQGPFSGDAWIGPSFQPYAGSAQLPSGELTLQWSAPLNGTPPIARYWRILIYSTTRFYFQMRRVLIGRRFSPARNFSNGAAFGVRDLGTADFSRRGVLLRTRGAKLRTVGLTFSSLYKDELEEKLQPLLEYLGNTEMLALITDPDPHAQRSRRTFYGQLVGEVGSIQRRAGAWQAAINLVSLM
ncbi:hypothetical protein FOY91_06695 [Sphingomonas solaris]|uniref:Uncharacterized protein n=2 Tax=Alterirhizorhabdus solaris TaxID=2529389 RepID=A0A558R894_9SPHN|nr:hypothetical protein FOY91_06695 [Sphingomonas solaris]